MTSTGVRKYTKHRKLLPGFHESSETRERMEREYEERAQKKRAYWAKVKLLGQGFVLGDFKRQLKRLVGNYGHR